MSRAAKERASLPWARVRPRVLALVCLVAALLLGLAVVQGMASLFAAEEVAAPAFSADKSLGSNVDLAQYDKAMREAVVAKLESAGFKWVRQRFAWDAIEPARGQYDWTASDAVVETLARHNVKIVAVLDGAPRWARVDGDADNPLAPPAKARDFGAFAQAFAARYGDRIDYYQVWDEPNIAPHWGAREVDPAAYGRLLREGAIQLRAADSGAVVLLAALAPTLESGGANMSELTYLDGLYLSGAGEWFDIVSAQLYPFEEPPEAKAQVDHLNWQRVALLREVMMQHGDQETAVWAVRFGGQPEEAEKLSAALASARQGWPWLGPMLWTAWAPGDLHGEYALADTTGQTGPIFQILAESARQSSIAWPGSYSPDHLSGQYTGNWRVTALGADIGGSGDRLLISFWGSRLDLAIRRGDYRAFLFVTIDGQPANALPHDEAGRTYLVLYDPLFEEATVTLARGLTAGEHTAEIVADQGWDQWAIAGWQVWRETPKRPGWVAALVAAALLALIGLGFRLWPRCHGLLITAGQDLLTWYGRLDDRLALGITAAALGLVVIGQGTAPSFAALALLGIALFLRPETDLPLIALLLPFYQPGKPLLGRVFSLVEILTISTALAWGLHRLVVSLQPGVTDRPAARPRPEARGLFGLLRSRLSGLDWAVLALLVWSAFSLLWAVHTREAAREFRTVVLEAAMFYGLLRAMPGGRRDTWRLVDAWMLGAVAISVIGISQWAFGQNVITAEGVWRVRGFYGSPNNLALYLGRVFPLALAVAAFTRSDQERWRRYAYGLAAAVIALTIFLTYSRGAWLIGVPVALLFLFMLRGRRALVLGALLLVVGLAVLVIVAGTGRLTSLLDLEQGTTFFRLQLWRSSLAMVADHPLLGVGLDNFLYAYRTQYVLPTAWEEFNLSHPHNVLLDFWLRLGLPGLGLLVWLVVSFFRRAWRAYRRFAAGKAEQVLLLGLMAGMVNTLAHGMVDSAFFLVDLAFVFMLMLALVQKLVEAEKA